MPRSHELLDDGTGATAEVAESTLTLEGSGAQIELSDGMDNITPPTHVTLENANEVFGGNIPPDVAEVLANGGSYEISP